MAGGAVKSGERVVLFNTGSGVKYMESFTNPVAVAKGS
jgi:hypothetical protein